MANFYVQLNDWKVTRSTGGGHAHAPHRADPFTRPPQSADFAHVAALSSGPVARIGRLAPCRDLGRGTALHEAPVRRCRRYRCSHRPRGTSSLRAPPRILDLRSTWLRCRPWCPTPGAGRQLRTCRRLPSDSGMALDEGNTARGPCQTAVHDRQRRLMIVTAARTAHGGRGGRAASSLSSETPPLFRVPTLEAYRGSSCTCMNIVVAAPLNIIFDLRVFCG